MSLEDIRSRIQSIEAELFAPGTYLPTDILRRPDPKARLAHEQRFESLRREREELLKQLPPTGEAAGLHLVLGRTLGTTIVRESVQEPWADPKDEHGDDPHWRFAQEMGWSLE
jgi:hypothetical protein